MTDTTTIRYEIEQLQNKILELEKNLIQKEIDEENSKKLTFGYYFDKLFDFIKMKNSIINEEFNKYYRPHHNGQQTTIPDHQRIAIIKKHNAELVPALEYIYNAFHIINERLTKLENL
jgi:hypothetical protein